MGKKAKYEILIAGTIETVKKYYTLEDLYKDLLYKNPNEYWINVLKTNEIYTVSEFLQDYKKEINKL